MKNSACVVASLLLTAILAGCGSGTGDSDVRRTEAEKQKALEESAFGTLTDTMNRAADVDTLQQNRTGEIDAALEESEKR